MPEPFSPAQLPRPAQWALLVFLSVILAALLRLIHLPAALLLGPLLAGILFAMRGIELSVPSQAFSFAQASIGLLMARMITPDILSDFAKQGPLLMGTVLAVILAASAMGYAMSRLKIMPDTTAVWGLLPGAASTMMLMAQAFGADIRLVAFMQYLRVVFVAVAASLVGRFAAHVSAPPMAPDFFPPLHPLPFAETLGLLVICLAAAPRLKWFPAAGVLLPLFLGALLNITDVLRLELPPWFLSLGYALLGWSIGLRFTRAILMNALKALPAVVGSILLLMGFCGGLAWLLSRILGLDLLTTYLATSPGGLDSIAIIAAASHVNAPFILSLQTVRLLVILAVGPPLSRWVAKKLKP